MEDARAYIAAAHEWAELVREIGTARLMAQDAADEAIKASYGEAARLRAACACEPFHAGTVHGQVVSA